MGVVIAYETKLNSINKLTVEIEENFNNEFSILAYDEEGGVFVEKFAPTFEKAKEAAEKLHNKIVKEY